MFNRPTLAQLSARTQAAINYWLPTADALLRRNLLSILGRALAGLSHSLHGHLDWIAAQILPHTAEEEYLERLAAIWSIIRRPAVAAAGPAAASGNEAALIPVDTLWQRSDGAQYKTTSAAVIVAGVVTLDLAAVLPGAAGNCAAGTVLTLVTPLDGINPAATVGLAGLCGGSEIETPAALLQRLLDRVRRPPAGGNRYDYVNWALAIPGVARAWVLPLAQGVGTLDLLVLADLASTGSIVASPELCALVRGIIAELCPNDVKYLRVRPPLMPPLDFTLGLTPDTAAGRSAVLAEIDDLFDRLAAPGVTLPLSQLNEAISLAPGETDHLLTQPAANVTHAADAYPIRGEVTWL